jgi:hypothetical protein
MSWKVGLGVPRRLLTVLSVAGILGGSLSAPIVPSVFADSRCGGSAGVQVWQDGNNSGSSAVWCTSSGSLSIPILGNKTDNLYLGANWNDRISSFQTFNQTSSGRLCLVQDNNYYYYDATRNATAQGNYTSTYVGGGPNDQASSLLMRSYNFSCPISN